jgi:oligopeptide/dipeptide ABC transporter ATP-binding protein
MAELILSTDAVEKTYRGRRGRPPVRALRGVTISLHAGRTLGIVGESGCGKSTLARLLVGLEPPSAGTIFVAGTTLTPERSAGRGRLARQIQLVFQDPYSSLDPRLTVERALGEVLKVHGLASGQTRARVLELLGMVALPERFAPRYPHELSGGQAQRVAIARALAVEPKILVLDEPTSALDVSVRAEVMNLLVRLQDDLGLGYVFVSHDLSMVRHISDEIFVMYLGRVVEAGPYLDVLDRPLHPYTRALAAAVPVADPALAQRGSDGGGDGEARSAAGEAAGSEPEGGCPYRPRCPLAIDVCASAMPELSELRPGHLAACHVAAQARPAA